MPLISKHIFSFPFRWDIKVENEDHKATAYTKRTDMTSLDRELISNAWQDADYFATDTPANYNTQSYFYPFVRKIILPDKDYELFKQYTYPIGKNATYQIRVVKTGNEPRDHTYTLNLTSVTLNIYDLGIGILSFSLENLHYDDPEDILHINDYGRRLYPQYIGPDFDLKYTRNSFLPASIRLENKDKSLNIFTDFAHEYNRQPAYLPPHILDLLHGEKKDIPFFKAEKFSNEEEGIRVEPILDDRMFVLCWYANTAISEQLSQLTDLKYNLTTHNDFWYRYVYVDTDLTCPDPLLKKELLDQSTYTRWAPSKTLFGISRYSFVVLTDEEWFGKNILSVHLTTIYNQLITICLVQRAALLRFSAEVSYISRQIDIKRELTFTSAQVQQLNRSYIQFDNRYYFKEVTAQEQGIELYDNIHKHMRLSSSAEDVKREISELNKYIQTASSETQRVSLERVSLLGSLFLIPSFLLSYFGWGILDFSHVPIDSNAYLLIIFSFIVLFTVGYLAFFAKPDKLFSTQKTRTMIFRSVLVIVAGLVGIPVFYSMSLSGKTSSAKSGIDSTAIRQIDSLRNEVRLLRQYVNRPVFTKPTSDSR